MTPLQNLRPGHLGTLVDVQGPRTFRRRLLELGLVPGTVVRLLRHSIVHDLVEIEARGSRLSLRTSEADQLTVSVPDS
jgi:Fe2+ transport system protein FeoA